MTIVMFLQHVANGISLGVLYALVAIGYTMVYGILRLINFAHGDIFMIGAYLAFYGITIFNFGWAASYLLAIVLTALMGVLIERTTYRPLRQAPRISALISAIGVSFFLENAGIVVFGGRPKSFFQPPIFTRTFNVGGVLMPSVTLAITATSLVLLLALTYLVYGTKHGLAMRALAHDFETSRLMGINVDLVVSLTFAVGSALAAAGGILWSLKFPQINPLMGIFPGLKAFIAAVLGGIGSIPGAMVGGFLLGLAEILLVALLPSLSGYRDAFAFLLLVLVLLVRPTGIMGEKGSVKV